MHEIVYKHVFENFTEEIIKIQNVQLYRHLIRLRLSIGNQIAYV